MVFYQSLDLFDWEQFIIIQSNYDIEMYSINQVDKEMTLINEESYISLEIISLLDTEMYFSPKKINESCIFSYYILDNIQETSTSTLDCIQDRHNVDNVTDTHSVDNITDTHSVDTIADNQCLDNMTDTRSGDNMTDTDSGDNMTDIDTHSVDNMTDTDTYIIDIYDFLSEPYSWCLKNKLVFFHIDKIKSVDLHYLYSYINYYFQVENYEEYINEAVEFFKTVDPFNWSESDLSFFYTLNLEILQPSYIHEDEQWLEIYYSETNTKGWFKKEVFDVMKKLDYNNYRKLKTFFIDIFKIFTNFKNNNFYTLYKDYSKLVDIIIHEHNILQILIQFLNIYQNINHIIYWITRFDGCIIFLTIYDKLDEFLIRRIINFSVFLINSPYGYYILEKIIINLDLLIISDLDKIFKILSKILDIITDESTNQNTGLINIITNEFSSKIFQLIVEKLLNLDKKNYGKDINIRLNSLITLIQSNIMNFMSSNDIITTLINIKSEQEEIILLILKWLYKDVYSPNLNDILEIIENNIIKSIKLFIFNKNNYKIFEHFIDFMFIKRKIRNLFLVLNFINENYKACNYNFYLYLIFINILQKIKYIDSKINIITIVKNIDNDIDIFKYIKKIDYCLDIFTLNIKRRERKKFLDSIHRSICKLIQHNSYDKIINTIQSIYISHDIIIDIFYQKDNIIKYRNRF